MKLQKEGITKLAKKSHNKMCTLCKKSVGFIFVCSHCHETFCVDCRLPETHNCKDFNSRSEIPLWTKVR